jgi:hypothetical protein
MKNIYVVTSQYMPLIVDEETARQSMKARRKGKIIFTQEITEKLVKQTIDNSKPRMLAFRSKEEAVGAMALALKGNNTTPDFIDGQIPFFAVPVILTVTVDDDFQLEDGKALTADVAHAYFETNTIPYHYSGSDQGFFREATLRMMDESISKLGQCPNVFPVNKADIADKVVEAYYLAANPVRDAVIKLGEKPAKENTSFSSCVIC